MSNPELAQENFTFENFECCVYPHLTPDGDVKWGCEIKLNNSTLMHVCNGPSKDITKKTAVYACKELSSKLLSLCNHLLPTSGN